MNNGYEQHRLESKCPVCRKFLTVPMVAIKNVSLSTDDYARFRRGISVKYGSQTMCRNCRKLRQSSVEVSYDDNYGGTNID